MSTYKFVIVILLIFTTNIQNFTFAQTSPTKAIIKLESKPIKLRIDYMELDQFLLNSTYEIGYDLDRIKIKLDMFGGGLKYTQIVNSLTKTSHLYYEINGNEHVIIRDIKQSDGNLEPEFEWTDEYKMIDKYLCRKLIVKDDFEDQSSTIEVYVARDLKIHLLTLPFSGDVFYSDYGAPLEMSININNETVYQFILKSIDYNVDDSYFKLHEDAILHEEKD